MNTVPTARAEAAIRLLMGTLASYQTQIVSLAPLGPSRLAPRNHDKTEIAQQATVIRLASITEAFCADALIEAAERLGQPGSSSTMQVIWEESAVKATRTWQEQKSAYKAWIGLTVTWDTIDAMNDARNAIAHGLGALTRLQLKSESAVKSRLAGLGIGVHGSKVQLSDQSVRGLAYKCRAFILDLDSKIQTRLAQP